MARNSVEKSDKSKILNRNFIKVKIQMAMKYIWKMFHLAKHKLKP